MRLGRADERAIQQEQDGEATQALERAQRVASDHRQSREISFASVKQPDRLGPKITKLVLQRSIRRGVRTIWIPTKRLQGNVRVRLDVNEPGVVSVKLAGMGKTSKTKTRRTAGGRVLVNARALTSGLRPGKVTLTLGATDASRNASSKQLSVRR